jgi:RNA polymerase sporulation-specific sigma factor
MRAVESTVLSIDGAPDWHLARLERHVLAAQSGDQRAFDLVLARCDYIARRTIEPFFLQGADREDLLQEARVGLLKAVRDYHNGDAGLAFTAFAALCCKRQVVTAVKAASRQKHTPLNYSHSLSEPTSAGADTVWEDCISSSPFDDLCSFIANRQAAATIRRGLREALGELERQVTGLYLAGFTREEISAILGRTRRCVESTLWRAKAKLRTLAHSHLASEPGVMEDRLSYWGSLRSRSFHLPHCHLCPSSEHRLYLESYTIALREGFTPCSICITRGRVLAATVAKPGKPR